jgi:hypothetical protein
MKTFDPSVLAATVERLHLQWVQSIHKTVNGNLDMGVPQTKDSTGNYNTFIKGNNSGVLIRIGAHLSTDNTYAWAGVGVGIPINHGLRRQPIGCHLVSSNKDLRIWQPSLATVDTITLAPSDNTSYATIYIF